MASPKEVEVDLGAWEITEERVKQYLDAVGDASPVYPQAGLVPPLALAAYALGALLQKLVLPPSTIHSLQGLETHQPVQFGDKITGIARLGSPKVRGGYGFITISYTLHDGADQKVLTGKSTVLVPSGDAPSLSQGKSNRAAE